MYASSKMPNVKTEFSSFCVRRTPQPTIKATTLLFLGQLIQVIYLNVGLGENFRMKNDYMSANLMAINYAVTYDLRDRGLTQVICDVIGEDPDVRFFIRWFTPRPSFWYITCLNRSKNNKVVALNCRMSVVRLMPKN